MLRLAFHERWKVTCDTPCMQFYFSDIITQFYSGLLEEVLHKALDHTDQRNAFQYHPICCYFWPIYFLFFFIFFVLFCLVIFSIKIKYKKKMHLF